MRGGHYVFTHCICDRSVQTGFGRFSMEYLVAVSDRKDTMLSMLDLVDPGIPTRIFDQPYLNPHP